MDKYIRKDDMNDDLGVYRQESYPDMTISRHKHQELNVKGKKVESEITYDKRYSTLSNQEKELWELLAEGLSIRQAAKRMGVKQQTAQVYWQRIKQKLEK